MFSEFRLIKNEKASIKNEKASTIAMSTDEP